MPQTCSGLMQNITRCNVHVHLITILFLWCLRSKTASVCRLFFMFAPRCHSTRLLQRHNDADCAASIEQVRRMHDKGILFWTRKWTLLAPQCKGGKGRNICRNEIMSATVSEANRRINQGDGLTCWLKCSFIVELQQ